MSTTTIHLPEELKARIARAAERAGKTIHSFMLEALAEKAESEELRADFEAEADGRFATFLSSGETIPWADMRQYLEERAAGKQPARPVPKNK